MAKKPNGNTSSKPTAPVEVVSKFYDSDGTELPLTGDDAVSDTDVSEQYNQAAETDLTHDQVMAILDNLPGDEATDNTLRDKRITALQEANEREELPDLSPPSARGDDPLSILAIKIGDTMPVEADQWMTDSATKAEESEGAWLPVALNLVKAWNGKTNAKTGYPVQVPAILEWPIPLSSYKNLPAGSNARTDVHQVRVNGELKTRRFYDDAARSTAQGKDLDAQIAELEGVGTEGNVLRKSLAQYGDATMKQARQSKIAQLKKQRTKRATALKRGVAFIQVLSQLAEGFPKVRWAFTVPDAMKNIDDVLRRNKPIMFANADPDAEPFTSDPISLSQFNSLQLPKDGVVRLETVAKNGGTAGEIMAMFKRKKKEPAKLGETPTGDKLGNNIPADLNVSQFLSIATAIHASTDELADHDRLLAGIQEQLNKRTPEADLLVSSVCAAADFLAPLRKKYGTRYQEIKDREAKDEAADTAAKTGKAA